MEAGPSFFLFAPLGQVEKDENAAFLMDFLASFADQVPTDSELTDRRALWFIEIKS